MSTVGNIVFCFIMMSVSLILIVESVRALGTHANQSTDDTNSFHVPAIAAVSTAFFVKLCLFCYCWGLRQYSQVCRTRTSCQPRFAFCGKTTGMIYSSMDSVLCLLFWGQKLHGGLTRWVLQL